MAKNVKEGVYILPKLQNAKRDALFICAIGNSFYRVNKNTKSLIYNKKIVSSNFNTEDFDFVFSNSRRHVSFKPKESAGSVINNSDDLISYLDNLENIYDKDKFFIYILLDDKFWSKFVYMKNIFIDKGWSINWRPLSNPEEIQLSLSFKSYRSY